MNVIAAVSLNWGIGREGELLFHIADDLRRFRAMTLGGTVVMGRRTLDALPGGRPLDNRRNIVLTREPSFFRPGVEVAHTPEEILAMTAGEDPERVWLCGGGEVYRLLLPCCRLCCLTRVYASPAADVFFPDLDRLPQWRLLREEAIRLEGNTAYQFVDYIQQP